MRQLRYRGPEKCKSHNWQWWGLAGPSGTGLYVLPTTGEAEARGTQVQGQRGSRSTPPLKADSLRPRLLCAVWGGALAGKPLTVMDALAPWGTVYCLSASQNFVTNSLQFAYSYKLIKTSRNWSKCSNAPPGCKHTLCARAHWDASMRLGIEICLRENTQPSPLAHSRTSWPPLIDEFLSPFQIFCTVENTELPKWEAPSQHCWKPIDHKQEGPRFLLANTKNIPY